MAISEDLPHLEYISYFEGGGGWTKMKGNNRKSFVLYLTRSFPCRQFYYLTIFQVELAGSKRGNRER